MRAAAISSRISAEPACCPTATLRTGQPKLMSISAAPSPTAIRAASAIAAGSHPASCTADTPPQPSTSAMRSVLRFSRTIAHEAIISLTTSPAPSSALRRRNGKSVTPRHRRQDHRHVDLHAPPEVNRLQPLFVRTAHDLCKLFWPWPIRNRRTKTHRQALLFQVVCGRAISGQHSLSIFDHRQRR